MNRIYLDNAATTPLLPAVLEAMLSLFEETFGNPSSTHATGRAARAAVEQARRLIAGHIGAEPGEIVFTSGGTEANNMVLKCAVHDFGIRHLVTSPAEHSCVRNATLAIERDVPGVRIHWLEVDQHGRVTPDVLDRALATLNGEPALVSLMHANNEIGTLHDIESLGSVCRTHGARFHSDTVQTIGHMPLDVSELPIDYVSASAHKLHGPKGSGFVYMRGDQRTSPLIHGGGQERGARSGTENPAGIVGLATALDLALTRLAHEPTHVRALRERLRDGILRVAPNARILGHPTEVVDHVLSVGFCTASAGPMVGFQLDMQGVDVSGGSACSSGAQTRSHVLQAIGLDDDYTAVRFSFSHLNTTDEVDRVIQAVRAITAQPAKA